MRRNASSSTAHAGPAANVGDVVDAVVAAAVVDLCPYRWR